MLASDAGGPQACYSESRILESTMARNESCKPVRGAPQRAFETTFVRWWRICAVVKLTDFGGKLNV
jgi:hypothetical protein